MLIAKQSIPLACPADVVAQFIMMPQAILDYYPDGQGGESLDSGRALSCWSQSRFGFVTASYLSQQNVPSHWAAIEGVQPQRRLVLKVESALLSNLGGKAPYTAQRIRQRAFFSMWEDWRIYRVDDQHSVLEKLWLDLEQYKWRFLPIRSIVAAAAQKESKVLQEAWNARHKKTRLGLAFND